MVLLGKFIIVTCWLLNFKVIEIRNFNLHPFPHVVNWHSNFKSITKCNVIRQASLLKLGNICLEGFFVNVLQQQSAKTLSVRGFG